MRTTDQQDLVYEAHAALCKTFASPLRLRILETLGDRERTVSQLAEVLSISKSNVSQHLGIMREKGVVAYRREGGHVFYRISNPKILVACRLMREVLLEHLEQAGELSRFSVGQSQGEA